MMSYHTDLDKGLNPNIEMPPLPEEQSNPETVEALESLENASEEVVAEKPQEQEVPKPRIPEENLRNLRLKAEKADKIERERDELLSELAKYRQSNAPVPEQEEDYSLNIGPDDLAEGKHLSKMDRKVRALEKKLYEQQQQTYAMAVEARLKTQYPDFDAVVNKDNLSLLKDVKPHLFSSIQYNPDMYYKAVAAYDDIKSAGLIAEKEDIYDAKKEIVQKNASKPRPVSSIGAQHGDSPLSRVNAFASGLTDDLKKQLHKEMLDAMKSR